MAVHRPFGINPQNKLFPNSAIKFYLMEAFPNFSVVMTFITSYHLKMALGINKSCELGPIFQTIGITFT